MTADHGGVAGPPSDDEDPATEAERLAESLDALEDGDTVSKEELLDLLAT